MSDGITDAEAFHMEENGRCLHRAQAHVLVSTEAGKRIDCGWCGKEGLGLIRWTQTNGRPSSLESS